MKQALPWCPPKSQTRSSLRPRSSSHPRFCAPGIDQIFRRPSRPERHRYRASSRRGRASSRGKRIRQNDIAQYPDRQSRAGFGRDPLPRRWLAAILSFSSPLVAGAQSVRSFCSRVRRPRRHRAHLAGHPTIWFAIIKSKYFGRFSCAQRRESLFCALYLEEIGTAGSAD